MTVSEKCIPLFLKLKGYFSEDLMFHESVRDYIDTIFLHPSAAWLENHIHKTSGCENDTLLELIFFPDEDLQCDLEPLLRQAAFDRSDEQHIVRGLMDEHLTPVFHFSDRQGNVAVPLTEDAAQAFVRRLNIARNLNPHVVEAIEAHIEEKIQNRTKVRLRNSRFSRTEGKAAFLCLFFRKLNRDDLFSHLDFMLEFFDETPEDVDIPASLFLKKRRLHCMLQQAIREEAERENKAMETIMLSGRKVPHVDMQRTRRQMTIIDHITLDIFGVIETVEQEI